MKGLLLKEFYTVRRCLWEFPLLAAVLFVQALVVDAGRAFGALTLLVYTLRVLLAQQESDDRCGWHNYSLALPVRRGAIVGARYLVFLLLLPCVAALAVGLTLLTDLATGAGADLYRALLAVGGGLLAPLVASAVFAAILYHFGTRVRGRFTLILMCMIPLIIFSMFLDGPALFAGIPHALAILFGGFGSLLLVNAVAAVISARLYARADPPKDYAPPATGPATL